MDINDMSFNDVYNLLNDEQKEAFNHLTQNSNVFITGNAGTGKSFLIKAYDMYCKENGIQILKTAPTGIASNEIGGATLHLQFKLKIGLDFGKVSVPDFLPEVDTLLIDEISMVRLDIFDRVMAMVEKANKKRAVPIQLVFVGDFYQLSPVITKTERPLLTEYYGSDIKEGYCFQSKYWKKYNIKMINLKTVIRQKDNEFCSALNRCKRGDSSCINYLQEHSAPSELEDAIWVCGKNSTVEQYNKEGLECLEGSTYVAHATYEGQCSQNDRLCENELFFKIGARVVMTVNDYDYNNGSLGTIDKVENDDIYVCLDNGVYKKISRRTFSKYEYKYNRTTKKLERKTIGKATQFPMRLGFAVTVHKAQGQTYDKMNLKPEIFSNGQLYVALSRCKSIENIFINGRLNDRMFMCSDEVNKFYNDPSTYFYFR